MHTLKVGIAYRVAGLGRTTAYREIKEHDSLLGVPVLHSGNAVRVPLAPFAAALGVTADDLRAAAAEVQAQRQLELRAQRTPESQTA
jgi:hypothetical protein